MTHDLWWVNPHLCAWLCTAGSEIDIGLILSVCIPMCTGSTRISVPTPLDCWHSIGCDRAIGETWGRADESHRVGFISSVLDDIWVVLCGQGATLGNTCWSRCTSHIKWKGCRTNSVLASPIVAALPICKNEHIKAVMLVNWDVLWYHFKLSRSSNLYRILEPICLCLNWPHIVGSLMISYATRWVVRSKYRYYEVGGVGSCIIDIYILNPWVSSGVSPGCSSCKSGRSWPTYNSQRVKGSATYIGHHFIWICDSGVGDIETISSCY